MPNPRAPKLDASNSRLYRPRHAELKHAFLRWHPASYKLEWGDQSFDGPHMVIEDEGVEYGSELAAFFSTHAPIPEREDHYQKVAPIRAARVDQDTDLVTVVGGREEATATVKAGGYIVQNPGGEQYYNTPEDFERRYEPADAER